MRSSSVADEVGAWRALQLRRCRVHRMGPASGSAGGPRVNRILLPPSARMPAKKTVAEMLGEFLREAAVLLAVFIPLEAVFRKEAFSWWWVCGTLALLVVPILVAGMVIERRRPP
jgi:hypothetical protein